MWEIILVFAGIALMVAYSYGGKETVMGYVFGIPLVLFNIVVIGLAVLAFGYFLLFGVQNLIQFLSDLRGLSS